MNSLYRGLILGLLGIFVFSVCIFVEGVEEKKASEPVKEQLAKKKSDDSVLPKADKTEKESKKDNFPKKEESKKDDDANSSSTLMNAEELLNQATEVKLTASGLMDFTKVINLCRQAESKGLSEDNLEFCKQLRISTQLQRGLAISQLFMQESIPLDSLPRDWKLYRKMALDDLYAGEKEAENIAAVQLAIGRLNMLPEGDNKKAEKALDTAIKNSESEPVIQAQALQYRAELENNPAKVLELLEKAQKMTPENASVLALLAQQWLRLKDFDKSLLFIDKALNLDSGNKAYMKTKSFALVGLGKKKEAEDLYNKAMQGSVNILDQIEKGEFLASIGKRDEAIAMFGDLIKKFKVPGLYYFRAALYAQNKQFKEALDDLSQCLRIDSNFMEGIQLKGAIYLQQEKYDDAIKMFETVLAKKPHDEAKIAQLAYAWAKKGDLKMSLECLDKGLKIQENSDELLRSKGDILLMYGKWKETIAVYDKVLKVNPDDSGVLNNYSWLLSTSPEDTVRNGKRALEMAKKASELTYYKEAHILSTLGAAYAELGQFDKALEWSNKAVELAEKEKHDRLDDLKAEGKSYQEKKPWREIPEKLRKK